MNEYESYSSTETLEDFQIINYINYRSNILSQIFRLYKQNAVFLETEIEAHPYLCRVVSTFTLIQFFILSLLPFSEEIWENSGLSWSTVAILRRIVNPSVETTHSFTVFLVTSGVYMMMILFSIFTLVAYSKNAPAAQFFVKVYGYLVVVIPQLFTVFFFTSLIDVLISENARKAYTTTALLVLSIFIVYIVLYSISKSISIFFVPIPLVSIRTAMHNYFLYGQIIFTLISSVYSLFETFVKILFSIIMLMIVLFLYIMLFHVCVAVDMHERCFAFATLIMSSISVTVSTVFWIFGVTFPDFMIFIYMSLYMILYLLYYYVHKQNCYKTLLRIDFLQEDPSGLQNMSIFKFTDIVYVGARFFHPFVFLHAIFNHYMERNTLSLSFFVIHAKFLTPFHRCNKDLELVHRSISRFSNRFLVQIVKSQIDSILVRRSQELTPSLHQKLNYIENGNSVAKMKIKNAIDCILLGTRNAISSLESASKSIEFIEKKYKLLLAYYQKNSYVFESYSRFIINVSKDMNALQKIRDMQKLRLNSINYDNPYFYANSVFPGFLRFSVDPIQTVVNELELTPTNNEYEFSIFKKFCDLVDQINISSIRISIISFIVIVPIILFIPVALMPSFRYFFEASFRKNLEIEYELIMLRELYKTQLFKLERLVYTLMPTEYDVYDVNQAMKIIEEISYLKSMSASRKSAKNLKNILFFDKTTFYIIEESTVINYSSTLHAEMVYIFQSIYSLNINTDEIVNNSDLVMSLFYSSGLVSTLLDQCVTLSNELFIESLDYYFFIVILISVAFTVFVTIFFLNVALYLYRKIQSDKVKVLNCFKNLPRSKILEILKKLSRNDYEKERDTNINYDDMDLQRIRSSHIPDDSSNHIRMNIFVLTFTLALSLVLLFAYFIVSFIYIKNCDPLLGMIADSLANFNYISIPYANIIFNNTFNLSNQLVYYVNQSANYLDIFSYNLSIVPSLSLPIFSSCPVQSENISDCSFPSDEFSIFSLLFKKSAVYYDNNLTDLSYFYLHTSQLYMDINTTVAQILFWNSIHSIIDYENSVLGRYFVLFYIFTLILSFVSLILLIIIVYSLRTDDRLIKKQLRLLGHIDTEILFKNRYISALISSSFSSVDKSYDIIGAFSDSVFKNMFYPMIYIENDVEYYNNSFLELKEKERNLIELVKNGKTFVVDGKTYKVDLLKTFQYKLYTVIDCTRELIISTLYNEQEEMYKNNLYLLIPKGVENHSYTENASILVINVVGRSIDIISEIVDMLDSSNLCDHFDVYSDTIIVYSGLINKDSSDIPFINLINLSKIIFTTFSKEIKGGIRKRCKIFLYVDDYTFDIDSQDVNVVREISKLSDPGEICCDKDSLPVQGLDISTVSKDDIITTYNNHLKIFKIIF